MQAGVHHMIHLDRALRFAPWKSCLNIFLIRMRDVLHLDTCAALQRNHKTGIALQSFRESHDY